MKTKKDDFIELEFTAKFEDGIIFDTNIPEQAKKLNIKDVKPLALSIGHDMIIKGLDKELEEKEIGKKYSVKIQPEDAFGLRNKELIKMIGELDYPQAGVHKIIKEIIKDDYAFE